MRQLNWCLCAHAYMNELGKGSNYTMSKSHIHLGGGGGEGGGGVVPGTGIFVTQTAKSMGQIKEIRFFVERDADFKTKKLPLLKMLTVGIPLRSMDSSSLL